jgi:hypothetical protein
MSKCAHSAGIDSISVGFEVVVNVVVVVVVDDWVVVVVVDVDVVSVVDSVVVVVVVVWSHATMPNATNNPSKAISFRFMRSPSLLCNALHIHHIINDIN